MSDNELMVTIGGFLIGFWVVWNFIGHKSPKGKPDTRFGQDGTRGFRQEGPHHQQQEETRAGFDASDLQSNWFRTLEVSEQASPEEITAAYKRLIRLYHPDKVSNLGPEIQAVATEKAKAINAAYEYARQLRK